MSGANVSPIGRNKEEWFLVSAADQYGVRTVLAVGGEPVKFEIILEARISVTFTQIRNIPVPALDHTSCFAEKWLANADRWNDVSVMSRDAIDPCLHAAR